MAAFADDGNNKGEGPAANLNPSQDEIRDWRAGTEHGVVHLNAAGASPSPNVVHRAVLSVLERERAVGGYRAAAELSHEGPNAYQALAAILNCAIDEVALAQSAQHAWANAFYSLTFTKDDRILCFSAEYAGNAVAFLQVAQRTNCAIHVLPMKKSGVADLDALRDALASRITGQTLVALTHVNTDSSIVQPAAEVGVLARKYGALYLLDACQSVGQLPVDVQELKADFLSGTGRKWLRGPRGTGFLFVRRGSLNSPLVGEPQRLDHAAADWKFSSIYSPKAGAQRYEFWEHSPAMRTGLAQAAMLAARIGLARINLLSTRLAQRLREGLRSIPGVVHRDIPHSMEAFWLCDDAPGRCAIVVFEVSSTLGVDSAALVEELHKCNVAASVSPARHDFDDRLWARPAAVRMSPHYFNTPEEIDAAVSAVKASIDALLEAG